LVLQHEKSWISIKNGDFRLFFMKNNDSAKPGMWTALQRGFSRAIAEDIEEGFPGSIGTTT